jgi:hypothetical protein
MWPRWHHFPQYPLAGKVDGIIHKPTLRPKLAAFGTEGHVAMRRVACPWRGLKATPRESKDLRHPEEVSDQHFDTRGFIQLAPSMGAGACSGPRCWRREAGRSSRRPVRRPPRSDGAGPRRTTPLPHHGRGGAQALRADLYQGRDEALVLRGVMGLRDVSGDRPEC